MYTFTRITGSELVFKILDDMIEASRIGDESSLARKILEWYDAVESHRPASMAALNILRNIVVYLLENGLNNMDSFLVKLRSDYDNALSKAVEVASRRIDDDDTLLSNSNSLAVRRLIKLLREQDKRIKLYVVESRPGREGLLLAEYSSDLGFDTTLIVDSAARFFMKDIDKVVVGAEGIAANGAVVSKVGTSILALMAKEARRRVFVIAPSLKFSFESIYGELLKIPEGGAEMLIDPGVDKDLPEGYTARVPLYDVTPSDYIDAIATEYGLIAPQAIPLLLRNVYGEFPPRILPISKLIDALREKQRGM